MMPSSSSSSSQQQHPLLSAVNQSILSVSDENKMANNINKYPIKMEREETIGGTPTFDANEAMKSIVEKIMRRVVPSHIEINSDTLNLVTSCSMEFMSSLTCEAITNAALEKRNVATSNDLIYSVRSLGYEDYVPFISNYEKQRNVHVAACAECSEKPSKEKKKSAKKRPAPAEPETIIENKDSKQVDSSEKKIFKRKKQDPTAVVSEETAATTDASKKVTKSGSKKKSTNNKSADGNEAPIEEGNDKETAKEKKAAKPKKDWLNPQFVEEFQAKMREALSEENPTAFLKNLAKQINVPIRTVMTQFDELKQRAATQQP